MQSGMKAEHTRHYVFALFFLLQAFSVNAEVLGPGWMSITTDPVSPQQARTFYSTTDETTALPQGTSVKQAALASTAMAATITASTEIIELARALQYDPKRIYEFVHNYIDYVPYYGYLKGPKLTLLERSGNDFDQAALMIELLRASGHTAQYVYGEMTIPVMGAANQKDLQHWLSVDPDTTIITNILSSGGIPHDIATETITRVWVQAIIDTSTYVFDPAFKVYDESAGVDLTTATGYDKASLLSAAGGANFPNYVRDLNSASLNTKLSEYSSNLITFLQANHPNAEIEDVVGGRTIRPEYLTTLPTALPFPATAWEVWNDDVPGGANGHVHTVQIQQGDLNETLPIPDIAGRRLSLNYLPAPPAPTPVTDCTLVDPDNLIYEFGLTWQGEIDIDCNIELFTNTLAINLYLLLDITNNASNAFTLISPQPILLRPEETGYVAVRFSAGGQVPGVKTATLRLQASGVGPNGPYGDPATWRNLTGTVDAPPPVPQPTAQLWLDDQLLAAGQTPQGNTDLTLSIDHPYSSNNGDYADQTSTYENLDLSGTYSIISDFGGSKAGLLLKSRQRQLNAYREQGLADTSREVLMESLNIMGQTWMRQTTLMSNLLDELADTTTQHHHRFGLAAQVQGYYIDVKTQLSSIHSRHGDVDPPQATFKGSSFLASALEHGVLEQLQGAEFPAASTIKLLKLANDNGDRIYRADASNYASNIRSKLIGYTIDELDAFQVSVDNGAALILPKNGQIALDQWQGKGYVEYISGTPLSSVGMIIGGDYFGGYGGTPKLIDAITVENEFRAENIQNAHTTTRKSKDPVDMTTGAYLFSNTDLSLGGPEPRGLQFARFYNSDNHLEDSPLGYGWTHNYNIYLNTHSDVESGLGERQPIDAAALIVTAIVTLDLMQTLQPSVREWVITALVNDWAMNELLDNAVSLHIADKVLTFIRLPNSSYSAPPGQTSELVLANGLYRIDERFGTHLEFDSDHRISRLEDVDGNALTFTWASPDDRVLSVADDFGHSLTFVYQGEKLQRIDDSASRSVSFNYDLNGDLEEYIDAENKSWHYTYDGTNHRMQDLIDPLTTTLASNVYDGLGRVMTQAVPRQGGSTETYNFYFSDFINVEKDPAGGQTTYFIDTKGRTVAVEDALGNKQLTAFDGQNHVISQIDPRQNETMFVYDGDHNLKDIYNALQKHTQNDYDLQHRLIDIFDPLNHQTHFDYDPEHHLELTRDAELNEFSATYFPDGQTQTSTDGRGTVTTYAYDGFGNPDTSQVTGRPLIDTDYDDIGRLGSLTDQEGATTVFTYDDRDLVTEITDPLGKKTILTYDNAGQVDTVTDRNLEVTNFDYTPSGKLDTVTYHDNSTVVYGYDILDNLRTMTDSLGLSQYDYNAVNRIESQTDAQGFTVGYEYDAAGNLKKLTYPDNQTVSYTYDALNRLETVTIDALNKTARYDVYDDAGRLKKLINFNGTITEYDYDDANRLISIINKTSSGSIIASQSFPILDGNGNRKQEVREEPQVPISLANSSATLIYNLKKNRLETAGSETFGYDDEGQLNDKSGTLYTFDVAHRLTGIGSTTQFDYDGIGNRLKVDRNGQITKYIYDASGNLLAEANNTGTITRYYVHGAGLLGMVDNSQVYSYHFDAIGSTWAITDNSQNIVNAYSYTPYGVMVDKVESITQPFTYVGQLGVMSETNGLYYMRARYYNSFVGRFISEDPIGLEGGANLYAYASGNPVLHSDPTGLYTFGLSFNVGGGAGYGGTTGLNFVADTQGGFEIQRIVGGGSYVGASGGFSLNLESTNADSIQQLRGFGLQVGGSIGEVLFAEGGTIAGPGYAGIYGGIGIGGGTTPAAGYGYTTYTTPYNASLSQSSSAINGTFGQRSGCTSKCF